MEDQDPGWQTLWRTGGQAGRRRGGPGAGGQAPGSHVARLMEPPGDLRGEHERREMVVCSRSSGSPQPSLCLLTLRNGKVAYPPSSCGFSTRSCVLELHPSEAVLRLKVKVEKAASEQHGKGAPLHWSLIVTIKIEKKNEYIIKFQVIR